MVFKMKRTYLHSMLGMYGRNGRSSRYGDDRGV